MPDTLAETDLDKTNPIEGSAPPEEVLSLLMGYKTEGQEARKSGPDARDKVWDENVDLYWNRFDWSDKADWQAREVMPEAPVFVDRWAAAMSEALTTNDEWFTAVVPGDKEGDLTSAIVRFMRVLLGRCGRNQLGQVIGFETVFEEQMKMGALMAACASVTWKDGGKRGYVSVEAFDPRNLWFDPKGRGLYRFRRTEVDLHDLVKLAKTKGSDEKTLYKLEAINRLVAQVSTEMQKDRESSTGHGGEVTSKRKPIILDEYLCTIIDNEGIVVAENQLCVVANDVELIRGPEVNPFWHKRDWMVYTPLITVPLAPYGKSYMENWSGLARAYVEMTNLILDGTRTSAMNAFAGDPSQLENTTQLTEGVSPNKYFVLSEDGSAEKFIAKIELGRLPPEVIAVWQGLKKELQEGSNQSELALGQFPTKSRITAREVEGAERGGAALIASMSRTVEGRHLEPQLNLIWRTALQHMDENDTETAKIVGEEMYAAIFSARKELAEDAVTFPVRGISAVIERGQKLQRLLNALQVIGQSEIMTVAFFKSVPAKVLNRQLLKLFGIDMSEFKLSEREEQLQALEKAQQQQQVQGQKQPQAPPQPTQ